MVDTLVASGKPLHELKSSMRKYPQVLVNVRVGDKSKYQGNTVIESAIAEVEGILGITAVSWCAHREQNPSFASWRKARTKRSLTVM